ncbi:hypothetical protein DMB66_45240 [Actinoplanes sp. ATCC 53533]|uniref:hypothetical protein n=1 Tax=Actinoplanes sp. ATCC 53533 TaxID=1288362 RepID=UPI000F7B0474|nr:hypothetical protein [Actinoplanes sp. ATCC 53533]RSM49272.1 hypothetical protein DMB66_45240 [Actinoplanes sp. ATCC 53533]
MRGQLPNRFTLGESGAEWDQVEDYVADTIANAAPDYKPAEIARALQLAGVAPHAVARGIGKAALRDAALTLFREVAHDIPDVQLQELPATTANEMMFLLEATDGGRVLVDALAPDQEALTAEPVADMPRHWAVLFLVSGSDRVRFDSATERQWAAFNYRTKGRFDREALRNLLLTLLRESHELQARE